MKLIIDVPEEYYKSAKLMVEKGSTYPLKVSIANGIPLDVVLENKGEWITDKERLGYWISTCSECGHIFHGNEVLIYKPKFCANCGARMRGE